MNSILRPASRVSPIILPLFLVAAFFASCAQGKPEIQGQTVQLLRVQGPAGQFDERLSVFVLFSDTDGAGDFASIRIDHTDTSLFWELAPDSVLVRLRGKDRWTGSNNLAGPENGPLPEGSYTITITDLAGNEASSSFILSPEVFPAAAPVRLVIEGDRWILTRNPDSGGFSRTYLFLLNNEPRLVYSYRVPDDKDTAEGELQELRALARDMVSIQSYTENSTGTAGVLLTPVDME